MDDAALASIVVALISTIGLIVNGVIANRRTKNLQSDLQTNHGKRPGEYLEMIHDVRESQLDLKKALIEHTEQDSQRFEELAALIRERS